MPTLKAIYDHAGDGTTPAFKKGDILTLIQKHDSGWIEVTTPNGERHLATAELVPIVPRRLLFRPLSTRSHTADSGGCSVLLKPYRG